MAACELLVVISVGEWSNSAGDIENHARLITQVFIWISRLPPGRKSKTEGQLLSALHPHLPAFIECIPLPNQHSPREPEITKISDPALALAFYFVPLIPAHADHDLQDSLLGAVAAALSRPSTTAALPDPDNLRMLCSNCSKWLIRLIAKPLEGSVLRGVLVVLHRVVRVSLAHNLGADSLLPSILKSVAQRLTPLVPAHIPPVTAIPRLPVLNALALLSNETGGSWESRDTDSDIDDTEDKGKEEDDDEEDWDDEDDTTGGEVVLEECGSFLREVRGNLSDAYAKALGSLSLAERSVLSGYVSVLYKTILIHLLGL